MEITTDMVDMVFPYFNNTNATNPTNDNSAVTVYPIKEVDNVVAWDDFYSRALLRLPLVMIIIFMTSAFCYLCVRSYVVNRQNARLLEAEIAEECRRYTEQEFEANSLPSYSMVSGLPSYAEAMALSGMAGTIHSPTGPAVTVRESINANTKESSPPLADVASGSNYTTNATNITNNDGHNTPQCVDDQPRASAPSAKASHTIVHLRMSSCQSSKRRHSDPTVWTTSAV